MIDVHFLSNYYVHVIANFYATYYTPLSGVNLAYYKLMIFYFPRKWSLQFHANCLLLRQFAWNANAYFLGGEKKTISTCCLLKLLLSMLNVKHIQLTGSNKFSTTLLNRMTHCRSIKEAQPLYGNSWIRRNMHFRLKRRLNALYVTCIYWLWRVHRSVLRTMKASIYILGRTLWNAERQKNYNQSFDNAVV